MSSASPTKSTSTRLFFSKNIRLNLNSKFLPEDFFPESISQFSKSRKKSEKQNQYGISRKLSCQDQTNEEHFQFEKQAKNFQLLKKRLIKIKQSSPSSSEHDSKKKISLKKRQISRKMERKTIQSERANQIPVNEQKNHSKGYSRKLMDYMKKMKDVINIDIKFQEDFLSPVFQKPNRQQNKQNPQEVETDDSPKIVRFRPRSQITSRQKLLSKQKVKMDLSKLMTKPLKMKVIETSKLMRESKQKTLSKKSDRYNKFVDIQLNQEGMLTFYASPEKKDRDSYDSKKYSARSSLPRLQK